MRYSGLRRSGRSIIAALAASAMLAGILIGVGQSPAAAATPPVAVDDAYSTNTSKPLTAAAPGVLANDTDDVGPLTASGASDPPHGSVTLNANGSFTYNADANFVGTDSFSYTVSDGVDGTDTGLVTITVARDAAVMLKDFNTGTGNITPIRAVDAGNGLAFFLGWGNTQNVTGNQPFKGIYKTDGTTAGTAMVMQVDIGASGDSPFPAPAGLGNGKVVFYANDGTNGREPWVSDGSAGGTFMLKDINPAAASSNPNHFTAIGGGVALFNANDGTNGVELWKTDGTTAGTSLVLDINPGSPSGSPNCGALGFNGSFVWNSRAYFCATTAANGNELWTSDGTPGGTVMVQDIRTGTASASPGSFSVFQNKLWFSADDGTNGTELFNYDGTTVSAFGNFNAGSGSFNPGPLTPLGGLAVFAANGSAANGSELWKTDGTVGGTSLVLDIRVGTLSSSPNAFTPVAGGLVFAANEGTTTGLRGSELWRTDGTTAGTQLVKDIRPGTSSGLASSPNLLATVGSTVYMFANDGSTGNELWKTDGTTAGTVLAQDINPGVNGSQGLDLKPALGTLIFPANDTTHGYEPWRIAPPNNAPVATNDAYATNEDTALVVAAPGVAGNDTDADANVLHSAAKVTDPANGSVTVNGDGSFTYTPNANYNGPDSFTYKVSDGMNDSNVATVNLTVNAVVDIPVANNDSYSTNKNTSLVVSAPGVLGNDTDGDGDPLTAISVTLPANGAVAFNANGSFTYTPNGNYVGADSFTYKANDGSNDSNVATVNISVTLPAVLATPPTVAAGSAVTATWSGVSNPSATDWVGLYDTSATPDPGVLAWAYTGGASAGNLNLGVPAGATPGAGYELRLFSNNTYTRLATSGPFAVTASATTISASPGSVNAGAPVTATWAGIASPTAVDWVGLYDSAAAPDAGVLAWAYTGGGAGGNLNLAVPLGSASGGGYELRLFANNSYTRLATSAPFTVVASNPVVSASPGSVPAGSPVTATWSGIPAPSATDWVGLYANSSDPDPAIVAWTYTTGAAAGNLPLTVPSGATPGATYELRLFSNNTYSRLATSAPFTVTASVPATISSSVATVANGNPLTATWSGIPLPSATDWVGLYAASGDPDPAIVAWVYTGGGAAGSVNLVVPLGSPPGATYELRLYSNNTYTRLATSAPFSVT